MEDKLRIVAWFAFALAALIGYSIGGWMGLLTGLAMVPAGALAGAMCLAFLFGILGAILYPLAWMFGVDIDDS